MSHYFYLTYTRALSGGYSSVIIVGIFSCVQLRQLPGTASVLLFLWYVGLLAWRGVSPQGRLVVDAISTTGSESYSQHMCCAKKGETADWDVFVKKYYIYARELLRPVQELFNALKH